jgi:hypothetical protein
VKYLEWNNIISGYFFNPNNAGKDIHLYLSKSDLVNLGKSYLPGKNDDEIWDDFLSVVKYSDRIDDGLRIENSPIETPLSLAASWDKKNFPPFISFLVLFIIPLTESDSGQYNTNNYYGRVNEFFKKNNILNGFTEREIGTTNFKKISHLWDALEEWSIITMNCELGIFELKKFHNNDWIYVGKPFSQCLFTPREIRRLPELFLEAGLVPESFYSTEQIKKALVRFGERHLGIKDKILRLIKDDTNELGQSIIEIAKREYKKWTGESHEFVLNGTDERTKRNYTVAPLLLQFEINPNTETIDFSYRLYSSNDYPEDLKFETFENIYEGGGWSKTLPFEFKEKFESKDEFNKWIARFPSKEVRLFIGASNLQLSNQYWIETDTLSKTNKMYLLCKKETENSISTWGKHFRQGNFAPAEVIGLPEGYCLFSFQNPKKDHPEIPVLTIPSEKTIQLIGGLKVGFNTFLDLNLPEIEILNADGNEKIFIEYKETNQVIFLQKKYNNSNRWTLPADVILENKFSIKIENEILPGYESAYSIVSSNYACLKTDSFQLPKRDYFGRVVTGEVKEYAEGSHVYGINWKRQLIYSPDFNPISAADSVVTGNEKYDDDKGNLLLAYLTTKKESVASEFYDVFERIHGRDSFKGDIGNYLNFSRIKRTSLNLYDFLGYLDYDYQTSKIVVNPPQLIYIPVKKGRKVLLIGGRDSAFINTLTEHAKKLGLGIDIYKQEEVNSLLLIPDTITISACGSGRQGYGERELKALSEELKITFHINELTQYGLQEFSTDITKYESHVFANNEVSSEDYDWARKIFNPETLRFDKVDTKTFNTQYTLVEYKLREWEYHHKLWVGGKCYSVDKNWARYMIIKQAKMQVIIYDSDKQIVAIPASLPLPRILAEAIALLSGKAPLNQQHELGGRKYWYLLYENIPSVFIQNFFMKLGQKVNMQSL